MRRSSYEPLVYALLLSAGVVFGLLWNKLVNKTALNPDTKIEQVMGLVESEYVDSIAKADIEEIAISELLSSFDPHSVYIPYQYVEAASQDLKGGFEGVGIEFFMFNDTPNVVRVLKDGPAMLSGLQAGDRLLSVDTLSLIGMTNTEIVRTIKGRKNTSFVGTIYRPATNETITKKFERGTVKTPSVYTSLIDSVTLYVKVEHFAEKTHAEFVSQVKAHQKNHTIKYVVLDLRNNPGGYLQTAVSLLNEFIDGNELLAFTQSKTGKNREYRSKKGGVCGKMDLVCLVNNRSASASEIVSGAIQDLDRGVVIGSRTYGKGLVQETFQLKDGSQIRLTISRYYIPSGRSIQKPYDDNGYQELDSNSLTKIGKIYNTKNGREVKSEGGISPDIILEQETYEAYTKVSEYAAVLIDTYVSTWSTMSPKDWSSSNSINQTIKTYVKDSTTYLNPVKNRLVYQLFGIEQAYAQNVHSDQAVQRALQELRKPTISLNP
ncbi:MAG: carboxyl-terminal processing protease [bacterium]|jgi:carboxyl-terminal processing protease